MTSGRNTYTQNDRQHERAHLERAQRGEGVPELAVLELAGGGAVGRELRPDVEDARAVGDLFASTVGCEIEG